MGQLGVVEFVTLDGVVQGFASPDDDRDRGFERGGWGAPYRHPVESESAVAGFVERSAYLFGRRTYEGMIRFWPDQPDENRMAAHLNRAPKYVATRTLTELSWNNAHVLEGDLADAVARLKAMYDSVVVLGSGVLVEQLVAQDLVDTYRLFLHPLLLGTGQRLFGAFSSPQPLRLLDATPTPTGVVMLSYERDR